MLHVHAERSRARRSFLLAALLGAVLAAALLHGPAPAMAAGYPSNDCSGGFVVFEGYVVNGYYKLRTNRAPGDPTTQWFCVAVDEADRHFGAKFAISTGSGAPVKVDDAWTACKATPGKLAGDGGTIGADTEFHVEVDSPAPGEVQVCVMLDTVVGKRLVFSTAGLPSVQTFLDDAAPYPYPSAPSDPALASSLCQASTGGIRVRYLNAQVADDQHVWLYAWRETETPLREHVCWRVTSELLPGGFPFGGRITLDAGASQTFFSGGFTTDFTACDQNVLETDSGFRVKYHAGGTSASQVCVGIPNVVSVRLKADPSGRPGVVSVVGDTG